MTKISDGTFEDCHALTSVTIGDGVTNIGVHAFNRCISLTSIIIPNSIKTISTYAYRDCRGLKSVTIGNGVTNMGENAFSGCLNLDSVHITDLTAWCNITFPDNMSSSNPLSYAHHLYLNGEEIKDLIIPNDVTRINKYAFYGCSGLNSVTIPNSVTTIGNDAFQNCTGLTSLALGNNVTSIGHSAFSGCGALTSITITSNMTFLGSWAFCNCCSLTSLVIPNGIKTIQKGTVYGCSSLTSITIPRSIAYIQDEAFKNCASLTDVWCYAEIVPKPDYYSYDNAFNNSPVSSATLHVPAESLESYKTTSPWSSFGNIVPLTQDEIDAVGDVGEDVAMDMEHFDLQGRIISKTQKGLNVIRMSDGSAKKVFMK